ncbi:MAG: glycosyltransferase [Flavobacteriales bacterium]
MKRILILYRELAGYFIDCVEYLCEHHDVQADIVAYPINSEAPFQFKHSQRIRIFSRAEMNLEQLTSLTQSGDYQLIFCGGWFDNDYLSALRQRQCPSLLGFDNAWEGSLKQQLATLYARWRIRPLFDYAFVPGKEQQRFARKMGFKKSHIISGAYSCNVQHFDATYHQRLQRENHDEKKLIYAGRYIQAKFLPELFEAWIELAHEQRLEGWTLHAIGTGDLYPSRTLHPSIVHHGFLQPQEMLRVMQEGDAFILPSRFEPWGVVVHEFAAAGYPLILSSSVRASEAFLSEPMNGYSFPSGNRHALRETLLRMIQTSHVQRLEMGVQSRALAESITPATWASSLYACMA